MRLRYPLTNLLITLPLLVIALGSAWAGLWEGAAVTGGGAALLVAIQWFADRPRIPERVQFDATRIVRTMPNGRSETIEWGDVSRITIVTSDAGPAVEDVYWEFSNANSERGCLVANGAEGMRELLAHIQTFPGFDNLRVAEAMGSATLNEFVVWHRNAA